MAEPNAVAALQAENARLRELLESHGIEWRLPPTSASSVREPGASTLSTAEKVALFRRLFRGRTDVYPSPLGEQDLGQVGLRTGLRQRVARRRLREATHQVR